MTPAIVKLFARANIRLMEENNGGGNDLPGGKTAEQLAAEKAEADKVAADKAAADKAAADKAAADKAEADRIAAEAAGKDGKNSPTDAEAKLLKEMMQHKTKAKEAENALSALKAALGDVSADDVAKLIADRKDAERKELERRGEYDRVLEQVKGEHTKVVESLQAEIATLKGAVGQRDDTLVEMTVGRSFAESQFIRERSVLTPSIARREFGDHVDLVDGKPVVYDKPRGAAERTPLVGADGKPKSFEEGIAQLYEKHPESKSLLKAEGRPGAHSSTVTDPAKHGKDQHLQGQHVTGLQRIQAALDKNGGKV